MPAINPLFTTEYLNQDGIGNNLPMLFHIQDLGGKLDAPSEFMNEVKQRIDVLSVPEQATKTTGGGGGSAVSATNTTGGGGGSAVSVLSWLPEQATMPEQVTKTTGGGGSSAVSATKTKGGGSSAATHVTLELSQVTYVKEKLRQFQSENLHLQRQIEKLKSEKEKLIDPLQRQIEKLKSEKEKLQQRCTLISEFYEKKSAQMSAAASGQCFP